VELRVKKSHCGPYPHSREQGGGADQCMGRLSKVQLRGRPTALVTVRTQKKEKKKISCGHGLRKRKLFAGGKINQIGRVVVMQMGRRDRPVEKLKRREGGALESNEHGCPRESVD